MPAVESPADTLHPARLDPGNARQCLNCGSELRGAFCGACGQRDLDPRPTLRELVHEAAGELLSVDGKVASTARELVLRPGLLTCEYLAGRRIRFLSPLRAYLTASVVFFTLLAVLPDPSARAVQVRAEYARAGLSDSAANVQGPALSRRLQRGMRRAQREPELFDQQLAPRIPAIGFVLCPAFALLLAVAFRRRGRFYPEHLAFALHAHAFAFLAIGLALFARLTGSAPLALDARFLALAVTALWLFVGLRRVYGGGRLATLLRLVSVVGAYLVIFGVTLVIVVAYSYIAFSPA